MVRSESKQQDPWRIWHDADAGSRQDISTRFRILIEFEATEYSIRYSIRMQFQIRPILMVEAMSHSKDIEHIRRVPTTFHI